MAEEKIVKQKSNTPSPEKQMPSNVVPLGSNKCIAEGCSKKPSKASFCDEHYEWFKEGLITKEGMKARDFDKKYHSMLNRKKVA